MKVKIIDQPRRLRGDKITAFEELINSFIKDKKVIDIEYQWNAYDSIGKVVADYERSVMIMYEE
ncbi:hypothetical protein [Ligilactobacillus murinus]|uniref:Uncharacterized protein n=1 Tax=Ligilactobacillus murinus TaxID=1622 RepID=A0AAE6WHV5_9LACO|nr:hypothetical protein [Ligilactobacillus murinus]NEF83777.1 hypothetical protein [Ligilactobacillus murinus]NEF86051.1 hypothetical protein [Ligilactobacillus murinus]NEF88352.1 hypothetical protein [Ligilactobacillus murinus]NEF90617.1 hypothetical protein [Ligilactobacillus murinus]NEF92884.1 hypothetical protein [Ligilactobacillus murinus]